MGSSLETAFWGTDFAKRWMLPRSLDTSGKVKLKGSSNKGRDLLPLCVTQLCSFLKSSKFLSHKQWELLPILR